MGACFPVSAPECTSPPGELIMAKGQSETVSLLFCGLCLGNFYPPGEEDSALKDSDKKGSFFVCRKHININQACFFLMEIVKATSSSPHGYCKAHHC